MKFTIKQIYNNNSALVQVDVGKEAVVQGKGIGFGRKKGDILDSDKVEKVLYLGDFKDHKQLANLLKNIPLDIVTCVWNAIDEVKKMYDLKLLNYLYVTLSDHVFQAARKLREHTYKPNPLPAMKDKYPKEYLAAEYTLQTINRDLELNFPPEEAKSIALHYINAEGEETEEMSSDDLAHKINVIVTDILKEYGISRKFSNANYYDRLMIHLKYLVDRMENNDQDAVTLSPIVIESLKKQFPESTAITKKVIDDITEKLNITLTDNEKIYFLIHIQRIIQEK
jgi:transcriptional antiterminator